MKKIIIAAVILAIIIGAVYFLVFAPTAATAALLYVESGTVQVDTGNGWQTATDEMELKQGAKVKTAEGEATVVFYEGEIMHLQPNTEVQITGLNKKAISVSQLSGQTWNKVTKISGISEYTVDTPTTVATVRGTEFIIDDQELMVGDGEVGYKNKETKKEMKVKKLKRAMKNAMEEEDMTEEEMGHFKNFPAKYAKVLERVREFELKKHKQFMKLAEKKGMTEENLRAKLKDIDEGKEDLEKTYDQIPSVVKGKAKRAYELTKEIKKAKEKQ